MKLSSAYNRRASPVEAIQKRLVEPLVGLLARDPGVTRASQLADHWKVQGSKAGQICGKVFKLSEPTYSCKECATDPTCVLCYECFAESEHKHHKYRMSSSGGSGYCDCGDPEAWKTAHACARHASKEQTDSQIMLPEDVALHCRTLLKIVLQYSVELLCWEYSDVLPEGIKPVDCDPPYQTMLFNDETHTYQQVIQAVKKAIDCREDVATYLATVVDREGRSFLCSGSKQKCETAKQMVVEKTSRGSGTIRNKTPLLVEVMDSCIVSHQLFAFRLLQLVVSLVHEYVPLLPIVCDVFFNTKCLPSRNDAREVEPFPKSVVEENQYLFERTLTRDVTLWKSARNAFHQLIMATFMKDNDYKRKFTKRFALMYPDLMQKFVEDDHDHHASVVSLTVQIFTVPSLARMLIAEDNIISIVLGVVLRNGEIHRRDGSKYTFDRNTTNHVNFKRAKNCLSDLRYLLTSPPAPDQWTPSLRKGFVTGFQTLLNFMSNIQCMNGVTRHILMHQEYEPEWETAFTIQLRLGPVVTSLLQWADMDREVCVSLFRQTLGRLRDDSEAYKTELVEIANYPALCVQYDVSKQPVSIHLPISRLLAGLFVALSKHGVTYESQELYMEAKPSPEKLLELPLRCLVMVAQFNAKMWRRNGYSLINQIHNYTQPYIRTEMYNRDILMMQIGAALVEPNEFLIQLLYKFGLSNWAREDFTLSETDRSLELSSLIESFLTLLVRILAERYQSGLAQSVTERDCRRNEVIQLLCRGPTKYSRLENHIIDADDTAYLTELLKEVADVKKTADDVAEFELKPELRGEYNPYTYHFSKSDASKAELYQATLRKNKPLVLQSCRPPALPKLTKVFARMINFLNCPVMLQTFALILERHWSRSATTSEGQLHAALYLICIALQEESTGEGFVFTTPAMYFREPQPGILELLEKLLKARTIREQHPCHYLLKWTVQEYRTLAGVAPEERLLSTSPEHEPKSTVTPEDTAAKARKEKIMRNRQQAIDIMQKMQKNFMQKQKYEHLVDDSDVNAEDWENEERQLSVDDFPVCLGPRRKRPKLDGVLNRAIRCILCQESQQLTYDGRGVVLGAFVQQSRLFSKAHGRIIEDVENFNPLVMPADLHWSPHASTCGHPMHWDCWQGFCETAIKKEADRPHRMRQPNHYDIHNGEFQCPLCKRISNSALPMLPRLDLLRGPGESAPEAGKRLSDSTYDMIGSFVERVYSTSLSVNPDQTNERVPVMTWLTVAYTVRCLSEISTMDGRPVFGALNTRESDILYYLCRAGMLASTAALSKVTQAHVGNLLEIFFGSKHGNMSILTIDMFSTLVELCCGLPWSGGPSAPGTGMPRFDADHYYVLCVCVMAHTVQILVGFACDDDVQPVTPEKESDISENDFEVYAFAQHVLAEAEDIPQLKRAGLSSRLRDALLPFLRSAALFFHGVTMIQPPEALKDPSCSEFEPICRYIGLPCLCPWSEFFSVVNLDLVKRWCQVPDFIKGVKAANFVRQPVRTNRFKPLPKHFADLIIEASRFNPTSSIEDARSVCLCLVCGEMVTSSGTLASYAIDGKPVSASVHHMFSCCGDSGMLMRVRSCDMILLCARGAHGALVPGPYVDEFGETDSGFKRGNPLYLSEALLEKLEKLWLRHEIRDKVTSILEVNPHFMNLEWPTA